MRNNNLVTEIFDILFENFATPEVAHPEELNAKQCEYIVRVAEELSWRIIESTESLLKKTSFECESCHSVVLGKGQTLGQSIVCSGCMDYQILAQQVMTRGLGEELSQTMN